MEIKIIQKAGLSAPQAKTYLALVQNGALTPTQITEITGEKRTNTYALLEKLEKIRLVKKIDTKRATYEAAHPSSLEILAEKRRRFMAKNEQELKANISALTDIFYAHNETPGSKTLSGLDGIREVYRDASRTGETVYLLRTPADVEITDFITKYRREIVKKGIETYGLTQDTRKAREHIADGTDEKLLFHRTLMPKDAYPAPVSLMIYGPKVALISFGETQMSTIISSPTVAEAMRQIFEMLKNHWERAYPQRH